MGKAMFLLMCTLLVLQMPLRRQQVPAGIEAGLQRMAGGEGAMVEEMIGLMKRKSVEEPSRVTRYEPYFKKARLSDAAVKSCSGRWLALYTALRSGDAAQTLRRLNNGVGDSMLRETDLVLDLLVAQVNKEGRPAFLSIFSSQWTLGGDYRDAASYRGSWRNRYLAMTADETGSLLLSQALQLRTSENRILERLWVEGFRGGCGFGRAIIPMAVPSRTQVLPGGSLTAQILFAFYHFSDEISAGASSGLLENKGYGFIWRGRARGGGWQRVRGTATILFAPKQPVLDWSFAYFVMPAPYAFSQTGKRSLLYRCQANEVQLQAAAGYDPNALELRVAGAGVVRLGGGKYSVTVSDERLRQCRGLVLDGKDTIGALLMDVVDAPSPLPGFGGGLTRSALTAMTDLPLQKEEGAEAQIVSYNLQLLPAEDRDDQTVEVLSGRFAGEASVDALLRIAGPGDRLLFSSIVIRQGCGVKSLPGTVSLRIIK